MSLDIYFLNVGHGDCTVFDINGRLTMVDINNSKAFDPDTEAELVESAKAFGRQNYLEARRQGDLRYDQFIYEIWAETVLMEKYRSNLTDPVDFLKTHFPGRPIWRFILTHPDMDHMTGLYRLREEGIPILNFWDTRHDKALTPDDFDPSGRYDDRDWEEYQRILRDPFITKLT